LKNDATADKLRAFCRNRMGDFKVPKVIRITTALLPKSATGKVHQRHDLAALFKAARQ